MKKLLPVLIICLFACHSKRDTFRYFLFSYSVNQGTIPIDGDYYIKWNHFPRKVEIDSMIYLGLEYDKGCYSNIVINSFYEFKDSNDYNMFGDKHEKWFPVIDKKICPGLSGIQWGGTLMADTVISGANMLHIDKVGTLNQN